MPLHERLRIISVFLACLLQPGVCQEGYELISGDVTLGALSSVHNIQEDACGDYDVDTLKEMMAVKWFLDQLNGMDYIPGVKIGLEVYRTCQNGELAVKNTVSMLEKFNVLNQDAQTINSTQPLFGLLGPGRTQEAIVVSRFLSSLPASQRVAQISGSATGAELSNKNLYSNFFRVIPPDSTQVQVLLSLLQQLGWNYISIVYDNDAYGREAAGQLKVLASQQDLCVPSFESLPLDYGSKDFVLAADAIISRIRGGSSSVISGVVFIGSAATAREFVSRLAARASFVRFIFSEAVGLQTSVVAHTSVGKGALVAAPPHLPLPEFKTFWNSLWTNRTAFNAEMTTNTLLADYYTTATSCQLEDSDCWASNSDQLPLIEDDTQWLFEYYHVKAAAVFAAALKTLQSRTCVQASSGVCLELKELIRNNRADIQDVLQTVPVDLQSEFSYVSSVFNGQTNVGFDPNGEVESGQQSHSLYNVYNYRDCSSGTFCFQQVGMYTVNGELQLDTVRIKGYDKDGNTLSWPQLPKAQCTDNYDCLECLPPNVPGEIVFVPGDVYIVAVASVHDNVAQKPLQCGAIFQKAGADLVQSVLFAVQEINEKNGVFVNVFGSKKLGVVILNACFRELVIKERLIELHKGTLVLPDGRNSSEILPQIAGYVGAFFSSISIAMYEVLSKLDDRFVLLSPVNTSPELSDRSKYPQYLRLTPGHNSQVTALLTLLRELGHQYVQVVYDADDNYSAALKERINVLSTSKAFNICVVNNIASDSEGQSFYTVLDDLRKNLWAPLVIMTVQEKHMERVLDDILPQMTDLDKFVFLGTDAWARNQDVLTGPSSRRLLGSLTNSVELPLNQLFTEYLQRTDPLTTANPWLKYFWEARKNCYFDGSFRRHGKTGECPEPAELTKGYTQNLWLPFYINAVYAFALGLDAALKQHCGQSQQAYLCDALTPERLISSLKSVRLDIFNNGRRVNIFDSNGDGDVGYKLYQISLDSTSTVQGKLAYTEVGRYDHDSLQLHDKESLWIYKNLQRSKCPNSNACNACFHSTGAGVLPNTGSDNTENKGAVIAMAVIIVILIIAIIVLGVIVFLGRRRLARKNSYRQDQKFGLDNLAGPQGPESEVSTRPLPPVHSHSTPAGFLHQNSVTSGSNPRVSASGSALVNDYDYLHNDIGSRPHSYDPAVGLPRGVSYTPSSSSSQQPPVSLTSDGYVPRYSGGSELPEEARTVAARQNSQLSTGDYSVAGAVPNIPDEMARSLAVRQNSQLGTNANEHLIPQAPHILDHVGGTLAARQNGQLGTNGNLNVIPQAPHMVGDVGGNFAARQNSELESGDYSNPVAKVSSDEADKVNGQLSTGGNCDLGAATAAAPSLPLKFENERVSPIPVDLPLPSPHQVAADHGYLTPTVGKAASTDGSYMDMDIS